MCHFKNLLDFSFENLYYEKVVFQSYTKRDEINETYV